MDDAKFNRLQVIRATPGARVEDISLKTTQLKRREEWILQIPQIFKIPTVYFLRASQSCGINSWTYASLLSLSRLLQSCPTLSDPMDCSLPGSSVYGIFQARVLEWGAIAFSDASLIVKKITYPVVLVCISLREISILWCFQGICIFISINCSHSLPTWEASSI